MMTWNYRVLKTANGDFRIGEVFYNGVGEVVGYIEDADAPLGETYAEILDDFRLVALAFQRPVFDPAKDFKRNAEPETLVRPRHHFPRHVTMSHRLAAKFRRAR